MVQVFEWQSFNASKSYNMPIINSMYKILTSYDIQFIIYRRLQTTKSRLLRFWSRSKYLYFMCFMACYETKNIYRVHFWYIYISIHSLVFRLIWSLTFTRFWYAPNLSGAVMGGENNRRRGTEQQPSVENVINSTRFDIESMLNQHQNNISSQMLTSFSKHWHHSRYVDVILDTLTPFPKRRWHSRTFSEYSVDDEHRRTGQEIPGAAPLNYKSEVN